MLRTLRFCFCIYIGISLLKADVLPIQSFKTPLGLEVWLVEDHTSPIVSLIFNFEKAKIDSPFKPEASLFQSTILTGAGILSPLEMNRFVNETPAQATLEMGISRNSLNLRTTKDGLASSLKVWARLMGTPQFQKANLSHSKAQAITSISHSKEDLQLIAYLNLLHTIFPHFSFKPDFEKAPKIINSLTSQNLEKETLENFLNAKPKIVVVGDVYKKELIELLDTTFGVLPYQNLSKTSMLLKPLWNNKEIFIKKDVSQSVVVFGQPGINPLSTEYPKYLLLQYVLSGRLFDELREKRGLIYSIQVTENHIRNAHLLIGAFSCECTNAPQVSKFIRSEWERLRDFGITQKELTGAKLSFKRHKILSLTSTEAVAKEYADDLVLNLNPDVASSLLESAEKISLEEINKFVQVVLKPESLTFVLLGPLSKSSP